MKVEIVTRRVGCNITLVQTRDTWPVPKPVAGASRVTVTLPQFPAHLRRRKPSRSHRSSRRLAIHAPGANRTSAPDFNPAPTSPILEHVAHRVPFTVSTYPGAPSASSASGAAFCSVEKSTGA